MDVIVLIGRILFAFLFLTSGYAHFAQRKMMAQYAGAKGVPQPLPAVLAGGVALVLGGLMVLFGVWADLGALSWSCSCCPPPYSCTVSGRSPIRRRA